MPGLRIGLELEFGSVSLVSYRSAVKLKAYFGRLPDESSNTRNEKRSYELREIGYGMQVARSRGKVKVGGTKFLRTEIEVEGADKGKFKIPEMKSSPISVAQDARRFTNNGTDEGRASKEFEAQQLATRLFKEALDTSVRGMPDFHFDVTPAQSVNFFKLKRVLAYYNELIDSKSPHHLKALMQDHKLDEARKDNWGWAVGKLGNNKKNFTDATVQVNFEVPFRKIGTPGGLPKENFTSGGWTAYDSARIEAEKIVTWLCSRDPKPPKDFDPLRLRALFTLYFFGLFAHWTNDRRAIMMKRTESEEQRATANKSNWEVLPKVRWHDLWKEALTGEDRARVPLDGAAWTTLKTKMNDHVKAVGKAITAANDAQVPFRDGEDRKWNEGWMDEYHETLFHQRRLDDKNGPKAFSSTGKPLPVGQAKIDDVVEPLIVFETRRSGFNQEMSWILNQNRPVKDFVESVVSAQTL
jgi:hypothetical protein